MNEHKINVEGGFTIRLKTEGKYCDRDIIIEASGGAEDLNDILIEQTSLIQELKETLEGKASGGGCSNTLNEFLAGTLEEVDCDEVEVLNQYFFYRNPGIKRVRLANVVGVGSYNFNYCDYLESVDLPEASGNTGNYFCNNCDNLKRVNIPKILEIGNYAFQSSPSIEFIDLPSVDSIGNYVFRYATNLTTLILRKTDGIVSRGSSVLASSGISNKKGYVYVPSALIEDYKVASGWSTLASQFRALEDYTVDGTITGELDENKI